MSEITKSEITAAAEWFNRAVAAAHPNWVQEARYILRLRTKGYGYGKCARILTRLERRPYNRQTIKNRYLWALKTWRANT